MRTSGDFGFITGIVRNVVFMLGEFPSRIFIKRRASRGLSESTQIRSVTVEIYICAWILIELVCLYICARLQLLTWLMLIVTGICSLRISEILFTNVDIAIFSSEKLPVIASAVRTLTLTLINYGELWLCFSGIYSANLGLLCFTSTHAQPNIWDAIYFSGTTQLTIGYGDIVPVASGRAVALVQGFLSYLFALMILGKLAGLVSPLRGIAQMPAGLTYGKVGEETTNTNPKGR